MWLDGLVSVLGEVQEASERVVLLGDTPHHPTDPLECLATNERIEACAVPRSVDGQPPLPGALSGTRHGRPECSWWSRSTGSARTRPARWCSTTTSRTAIPAT